MRKILFLGAGLALLFGGVRGATAGSCFTGECHKTIAKAKFQHGPVAAENTGAGGCVSCHVPTGAACAATKGGQFTFKTKKERLCLLCHERGTGTAHTNSRLDCLSCHNPHMSETSMSLLRSGQSATDGRKPVLKKQ